MKAILESAKNLRKLFHQERWESAQADAETAATLTARRKKHVSTIKRAVFHFDPTGKDGKVPMNRQRKEVHRAARFGVGVKRTRAKDSETSREDYEQLLRSKTASFNEHPEDAVVGKGSGCGKKTIDMHWRQWQGALSTLKLTRDVPLPVRVATHFSLEEIERTTTTVSGEQVTRKMTKVEESFRRLFGFMEVAKTRKKHRYSVGSLLITKRFCNPFVNVFISGTASEGPVFEKAQHIKDQIRRMHAAARRKINDEGSSRR